MTKIISLFNHKGGVAKSTSSINIASCLSLEGFKVLLIDCDPQGNSSLSFDMYDKEPNIYDLMVHGISINQVIYKHDLSNIDILPSNISHAKTEMAIQQVLNRERILLKSLKSMQNNYDYIILDCPPSLGLISINALVVSTHVLIPIKIGKYSLMGLKTLFQTIKDAQDINEELMVAGIFITQDEPQTIISKQTKVALGKDVSQYLMNTIISRTVKVVESEFEQKPIVLWDANNKIAQEYVKLTKEVICRVK